MVAVPSAASARTDETLREKPTDTKRRVPGLTLFLFHELRRKMMGMVLSASTTVLADSTIRLLTANPTTASVRTTASIN